MQDSWKSRNLGKVAKAVKTVEAAAPTALNLRVSH